MEEAKAAYQFQSTPSAWRVTDVLFSYPNLSRFQSTPSAWRVTNVLRFDVDSGKFQSTPSAWRVTIEAELQVIGVPISIHTLRVEGDGRPQAGRHGANRISIHTLRVEGDADDFPHLWAYFFRFQSTPAAWRVTRNPTRRNRCQGRFQSTPSAWRVTSEPYLEDACGLISIHTLRVEGDWPQRRAWSRCRHFNPHPPRGG